MSEYDLEYDSHHDMWFRRNQRGGRIPQTPRAMGRFKFWDGGGYYSSTGFRCPSRYPYSWTPYFLWEPECEYTTVDHDRMRMWDGPKWDEAWNAAQRVGGHRIFGPETSVNVEAVKAIIDTYYEGTEEAVGYILSCNVSSGYAIGTFCLRRK